MRHAPPAALSSGSGQLPPRSARDPFRVRVPSSGAVPPPRASDGTPHALRRFFLASLKSAMIKGCREPPYPSVLTDATMEKLALAKFVAQESKCEVSTGGVGGGVIPERPAVASG